MFIVGLILTLILIFVASLCGTAVGLMQVWPRDGGRWEWKRARRLIISVIFLAAVVAYGVAWYIAVLNIAD